MLESNSHFEHLIQQIIFLLKKNESKRWVPIFKEFLHDCKTKQTGELVKKILSIYGGMGSFNDLVIQRDHKILVKEDEQLDKLREELSDACVAYVILDEEGNIIDFKE